MVTLDTIQRLVQSPVRMAALESEDPTRVLALFHRLALQTGQSVYAWRPERGIARLGMGRFMLPNTRSTEAALLYIASSKHFGIYILQNINQELDKERTVDLLQKIASSNSSSSRHVILLDRHLNVPQRLQPHLVHLRQRYKKAS